MSASREDRIGNIQTYIMSGELNKLKHNFTPIQQIKYVFTNANLKIAIIYYKNEITKWLTTGMHNIDINIIKTAIKFSNQYAIKEIYRKYKFSSTSDEYLVLTNDGFEYATIMDNLDAIKFMVTG